MDSHKLCVISTIHTDGGPEAAVIGFGQTEKLEVIFGTNNTSRKYQNLTQNNHVAIVIGWENGETMQYEGVARELREDEIRIVEEHYLKKSPESTKHRDNPQNRYFIVTPTWIRLTDLKMNPWKITEHRF